MLDVTLLGIATGMRSLTPLAVLCWAAYLGLIPQTGWTAWMGSLAAVIILTICALGEWVGDVQPKTPSRTALVPALGRAVLGMFVGVIAWRVLQEPIAGGLLFGLLGALIGTYGGHRVRMAAAQKVGRDLPVGIAESLLAAAIAILAAGRIYHGLKFPPVALLQWLHHGARVAV
jgi:uncharacterized membrane protein